MYAIYNVIQKERLYYLIIISNALRTGVWCDYDEY